MADKAMDVYMNDHVAGAMLGSDLAEQIQRLGEGEPLADVMAPIAKEIEEDRQTLIDLIESIGTTRNPAKQATTWLAEKASRAKFSGMTSGEPEQGAFMALESLSLGVEGKISLWKALKEVAGQYPAVASMDLDALMQRGENQRATLERERLAYARRALTATDE